MIMDNESSYLLDVVRQYEGNVNKVAKVLGIPESTFRDRLKKLNLLTVIRNEFPGKTKPIKLAKVAAAVDKIEQQTTTDGISLTYIGARIETVEDLLRETEVDLTVYEVDRVVVNNWETAGKVKDTSKLYKTGLRQIKVFLRKKKDVRIALEQILHKLATNKFKLIPNTKPIILKSGFKRSLEISIMDPHYGMQCYAGESNDSWSLEECEKLCLWSVDELIRRAEAFGKFHEIVFPFGNDFMHHDNLMHTTTKGTLQPEAISYAYVLERAITLAVTLVNKIRTIAPVKIVQVSGNHDYVSSFSLGHILKAYYRQDKHVSVDVSPSPYKFYHFGTNLIGFDHGHHINPIRLAAIMAHECRDIWAKTSYREWHLGDQHRKGSSKPHTFEEQGVSIEYLMALTPANSWHKLKGFNWQKRGSTGFIWDYDEGLISRVQVNLNSYTGKPTGR